MKMKRKFSSIAMLFLCLWNAVGGDQTFCKAFDPTENKEEEGIICSDATMDIIRKDLKAENEAIQVQTEPVYLTLSRISFPLINKFIPLSQNWLTVNMKLRGLNFSESNLQCIEEGAFNSIHFMELEVLNIENTPLHILYEGSFIGLTNLKGFFLYDVQLHTIQANVLSPMPKMEEFTLHRCGNTVLSLDNFFGTAEMFELTLAEVNMCNLNDTITASTFRGLLNIDTLYLDGNQITKIGLHSFDVIWKTARIIDLRNNKLKLLTQDLFKYSQKVQIIIENNPWHCDCDLEALRKFINETENLELNQIQCQSPHEYAQQYLKNLGPLCDEANISLSFSDDEIESSMDAAKDQIAIACSSTTFHPSSNKLQNQSIAVLTKSYQNRRLRIHNEDEQLFAHVKFDDIDSIFVVFELNDLWGSVTTRSSNNKGNDGSSTNCFVKDGKSRSESLTITLGMALKHNQMYRFCWIKRFSTSIVPSDCMTFYSAKKMEPLGEDTWILMENKMKFIIIFIAVAVFACIVSILFALLLAFMFSKRISKREPNAQEAANISESNECVDSTTERVTVA